MAQIVKAHLFAVCPFQYLLEPLADIAGVDGLVRLDAGREHQRGEYFFPIFPQKSYHDWRQDDRAKRCFCFRLADDILTANRCDLLADMEFPCLKVQVIPCECQYLTPAKSCGQLQQEEFVHPLRFGLYQKSLNFFFGQHLHFFRLRRRELDAEDGIFLDQAILDRPVQRHPYYMIAASHRPLRHLRPLGVPMCLPAVGLHFVQKLLAVRLRQLIQRDMPETGNSVDIDPLLIALLRSGADGWLAVIFIPVIHPIPKPHIRFYLEGGDLGVLLPKPFQLFHAFRLCFCQDAFLLCLSIFIVAHDVTAFPPSVASQADSTLTVFAFPCHVITPSPQSHS